MRNTEPGPSVARKTEVDWGSLAQPPVEEWKPTTPCATITSVRAIRNNPPTDRLPS